MRTKSTLTRRGLLRTGAALGAATLATPALMRRSYAQGAKPFEVWVWGGPDRFDGRLNSFAQAYPEEAGTFDVTVRSPGAHGAEVWQALRLALASGQTLPDVVMSNYIAVPEFAELGVLTDMSDRFAEFEDDLTPAGRSLSVYNDMFVGVPANHNIKTWFYNAAKFDAAGIDPTAVRTAADFMAAGQAYRSAHPDSYIMNLGDTPIHYNYFMMLSHWNDLTLANRDGSYNITSDPRFAEVFQLMHDWRQSGIAMPIDDWSPDWQPGFQEGRIGSSLIASWMLGFLPRFMPEQRGEWEIAAWPDFSHRGSEGGGPVFMFPNGAPNTDNAWEFMSKLHLSTEGGVIDWQTRGTIPGTTSALSQLQELASNVTRPADMTDEQWQLTPGYYYGDGFMDPIIAAMEDFQVFQYDPAAPAQLDIMRRRVNPYVSGNSTLEEALEGMQADMERQIGNPYAV
ncbi:extracellular solute-binding protein [Boseongicola sp. H5]|uniref:ABC transporter substrate-binding protein n=1 Tax=Boseongicola sp. H5 TaxID=2763261 RepID=UPI001D09E829|nr:extracellular solute-binding protein [Boseongicola sp. H5]